MLKFLFKSWLLLSVFSSSVKKQQRECNRLIAEHYKQLDSQVKYFKNAFNAYPDDEQLVCNCIAQFLNDNMMGFEFSYEDIDYLLTSLYNQGFPDLAIKIQKLIGEMPETELI